MKTFCEFAGLNPKRLIDEAEKGRRQEETEESQNGAYPPVEKKNLLRASKKGNLPIRIKPEILAKIRDKHAVDIEEVYEVFEGFTRVKKNRYRVVGKTIAGRYLTIFLDKWRQILKSLLQGIQRTLCVSQINFTLSLVLICALPSISLSFLFWEFFLFL